MAEGGLALSFSRMRGVRVDPERRIGIAQAGALSGDFYREAAKYGLAPTAGQFSSVGIGGFTLGGGIGWLARKYGLAADNLAEAEVVTADGKVLHANAEENPDLLWGLRGGGNNFGFVTRFYIQLHPVTEVYAGAVVYPRALAADGLRVFRDLAAIAPNELTMRAMLNTLPGIGPALTIMANYAGDPAEGEKVLEPLLKFGPPIHNGLTVLPYLIFQTMYDSAITPGGYGFDRSGYMRDLTDEAIDTIVAAANEGLQFPSQVHIMQLGGALDNVPVEDTAYPHRGAPFMLIAMTSWKAEDKGTVEVPTRQGWARSVLGEALPYLTGGVYVNFLGANDGLEGVRAAYGPNYPRLVALKEKYDPTNLFRVNHNIVPWVR